jgi:hypothetical protein
MFQKLFIIPMQQQKQQQQLPPPPPPGADWGAVTMALACNWTSIEFHFCHGGISFVICKLAPLNVSKVTLISPPGSQCLPLGHGRLQ